MANNLNLALVVAVVLIGTVTSEAPSLADYTSAMNRLKGVLGTSALLPEAVRLAFHDCVGPDGCDGCVNTNWADNAGLDEIITTLVETRDEDEAWTSMSNADFWQIAGIAAIELSSANGVEITFKGGRDDCSTSPYDDTAEHEFPGGAMSRAEMLVWFETNENGFSMTAEEVTALMGAHSLGAMHFGNSGYRGAFTPGNTFVFDNEFYQVLNNAALTFDNAAEMRSAQLEEGETDLKYEWTVYDGTDSDATEYHMLNTDIELAYDIDVDNDGIGTQCVIGAVADGETNDACSEATTKDLVATYATDQDTFFDDFAAAYEKMMEVKNAGLTVPV